MTAEPIAEAVAKLRAGRFLLTGPQKVVARAQKPQPVIDCTAIFTSNVFNAHQIGIYDDFPSVIPPWEDALFCYENSFGNVYVMQVHRFPYLLNTAPADWAEDDQDADWSRVKWIAETAIWVDGQDGTGHHIEMTGPCHLFRHAIYEDGAPASIMWLGYLPLAEGADAEELWMPCLLTLNASLNFLSATNVDIAEPTRKREVRRRLARTGVTVQTIVVRPPGKHRLKTWTGAARPLGEGESVLSHVRGHFAKYGPAYNRGLLFGRIAGRFWIPSHVRGAGDEQPKDYVLKPAALVNADGTIGESDER